jgi:hypothetical protein
MTTASAGELKDELIDLLHRSEDWLGSVARFATDTERSSEDCERKESALRALRVRTASTLLTVGMFGAFSSGKSLLLSGLQGGLVVRERENDLGQTVEQFISLLPSASKVTTAVPAHVLPVDKEGDVDASGRGFLRVRFIDSDADDWEDVGNSPPPAVLAAYAAADGDRANRIGEHWDREIAELELTIEDFRIPAKLYDLPGYGSPTPTHDQIVKAAMFEADCFIYVTHAARTLSENDLDLIRQLYQHCRTGRKRVLWVVTAIDTALQVDHTGAPAWRDTVEQNNIYLRENFTEGGKPDLAFIDGGFIGVSPALEARAVLMEAKGETVKARNCVAGSQMNDLRQALQQLIDREAGHRHIASAATEAKNTIGPLARELQQQVANERLPLDKLTQKLADQRRYLEHLATGIPELHEALETELDRRTKRAIQPFRGLARHLHDQLDASIQATDLRVPRKANQVQVLKAQTLQRWLEAPDGPATLWTAQLAGFNADLRRRAEEQLQTEGPAEQSAIPPIDLDSLTEPRPTVKRRSPHDLVKNAAAVVGLTTPVAAAATWLGTAAGAGVVFPPAAVVAGGAAVVYLGVQLAKKAATSLDLLRREWIRALDSEADDVRDQFLMAIAVQGQQLIENLDDSLDDYSRQVEDAADRIRDRINDPDNRMRKDLIERLEPLSRTGSDLTRALTRLAQVNR